jgi:hypothetical protein
MNRRINGAVRFARASFLCRRGDSLFLIRHARLKKLRQLRVIPLSFPLSLSRPRDNSSENNALPPRPPASPAEISRDISAVSLDRDVAFARKILRRLR